MPERLIRLEGTLNFRDLGGYLTADGGTVRWGRVSRSDALSLLTDADWKHLQALDIKTVVDFRRRVEVSAAPTRPPAGMRIDIVALGIGDKAEDGRDLLELVLKGSVKSVSIDEMSRIYQVMVEQYAPIFGSALQVLSEPGRLPAIIHCTAGKDRTGITAGLLLSILGVHEDYVLDDYELSTRYRSEQRILELLPKLKEAGVNVEDIRPYLSAPRPALAGALRWIRDAFGSVENYLTNRGGMDVEAIERLREELIDR